MHLKLATKFQLSLSILLLVMLVFAGLGYSSIKSIRESGELINTNYLTSIVNLSNAEIALADLTILQKQHIIAPNEGVMRDIEDQMTLAKQQFLESMDAFYVTLDIGEETTAYNEYMHKAQQLFKLNNQVIELSIVNDDIEADAISFGEFSRIYHQARQLGKVMMATNIVGAKELSERNTQSYKKTITVSWVIFAITIGVFFIYGWLVRTTVVEALHSLTRTMKALSQGKLDTSVPMLDRFDEIGEMARATRQFKDTAMELEVAEEKARESTAAKSDFLASMSHEVRTPLNGVLGMVDLVLDTNLNETQKSYIHTIQQSGRILTTVINDILEFSKLESGSLELDKKNFNLHQVIDHITSVYKVNVNDKIQLETRIHPDTPTDLIGDDIRLHQIIGNLLNNAFKFTEKGLVTLSVAPHKNQPDFICFSVKDTGIGINAESKKDLFQPFKQADQSTSRRYGGTGLGLVICKKLVELMEGNIEILSEPGKGTEFHFTAKLEKAAAPSELPSNYSIDTTNKPVYEHLNILLVEDNPTNQLVARAMLRKLKINITVANNGVEAVKLVCTPDNKFDAILMDCEMPIMDGYEATRRIRDWESEHKLSRTHICAQTAHVLKEHISLAKDAGMDKHITKPIRFADLIAFFASLEIKTD